MDDKLKEARALVLAEKKSRVTACWAEVQVVLEKHRCNLGGVPQLVPSGGVFAIAVQVQVSARED